MDHELAEYFSTRLRQLPDNELVLKTSQVIAVIGVEETSRIAISTVTLRTDLRPNRKKRSLIPADKRFLNEGYSRFNRKQLIESIEKARIDTYISSNGGGTSKLSSKLQSGNNSRSKKAVD